MKKFIDNLKKHSAEEPIAALAVASGCIIAIAKLMEANNNRTNAHAWNKEVDRRSRNAR